MDKGAIIIITILVASAVITMLDNRELLLLNTVLNMFILHMTLENLIENKDKIKED